MGARYLLALNVACLVLAGCESYSPAPLNRGAKLAERLADLPHPAAPGPQTIDSVGRLVIENNPDLRAARANRGVAAAEMLQAGILPNPSVNAGYAFLLGGPATVGALTASIGQDLKSVVTLTARRSAAGAAAEQVDASLLWQEWQTVGKARLLMVELVEGEKQRRLLEQTRAVLDARLKTERQAMAAGNVTLTTVVPAQTAVADLRKQLDDLDRQQAARRRDLNALIGLAPDVPLPLAERIDLPALDPAAMRKLVNDLADRRPDLIALQLGYRSQEEKVRAAILGQFPALVFGGVGGRDTGDVRSAGPQITMDLPLFNRNQGQIALARATRQKLRDEFAARLAAAKGEIQGILDEEALLARQIMAVTTQVSELRHAVRGAEQAYRDGNLDARGYVDLKVAALAKATELVALKQVRLERRVALATLSGAGMPVVSLADPGNR